MINSYYSFIFPSVIGDIGLVKSNEGLTHIFLPNQYPQTMIKKSHPKSILKSKEFDDITESIIRCFEGYKVSFQSIDVDLRELSHFAKMVLGEVQKTSYGATRTYSDIASNIGILNAQRSVGRAIASNPLPILIPCHRIIGKDGVMHGYIGGLSLKNFLLKLEGVKIEKGSGIK